MNKYSKKLKTEVAKYKKWLLKYHPEINENNDNGEIIGPNFEEMIDLAIEYIREIKFYDSSDEDIDAIFYCIARDNEAEVLADYLSEQYEWFSKLAKACIKTNYTTAKWQLAKRLPKYKNDDKIANMIYDYIKIDDEYTQRMSLFSLAEIYPDTAEKYAIDFWERDKYKENPYSEEYQKIMVLHVLEKIESNKLSYYIKEAKKSDYVYLKENAEEIEKKTMQSNNL